MSRDSSPQGGLTAFVDKSSFRRTFSTFFFALELLSVAGELDQTSEGQNDLGLHFYVGAADVPDLATKGAEDVM